MKEIKKSRKCEMRLATFVKQHLPASLELYRYPSGYAYHYEIYRRGECPTIFRWNPDKIGEIHTHVDELELFHPEYYSDFKDILDAYEKQTGKTAILMYWED